MAGRRIKKAVRKSRKAATKAKAKIRAMSKKGVKRARNVLARAGVSAESTNKAIAKVKAAVMKEGKRQLRKGKAKLRAAIA